LEPSSNTSIFLYIFTSLLLYILPRVELYGKCSGGGKGEC
jgi:hypothetical protein